MSNTFKMSAAELHLKKIKILTLLSLMSMIDAKICLKTIQHEKLVMRNGLLEIVNVNQTVKICCEGYEIDKTDASKCVSICPEGFINENGKDCQPRCDECENGTCMAPNVCQCEDDYVSVKSGCAPRCENECTNGYCAKPGICECNEGYVQSSDASGCVPICNDCINGFCEKPGECQCKPGYKWNVREFKCRPKCKKPCEHGYCSAPDVCACHKGYRHSSLHFHICFPDSSVREYDSTDDVREVSSSELPEIEGVFRYMGKKMHFVGHFDGDVEDTEM